MRASFKSVPGGYTWHEASIVPSLFRQCLHLIANCPKTNQTFNNAYHDNLVRASLLLGQWIISCVCLLCGGQKQTPNGVCFSCVYAEDLL